MTYRCCARVAFLGVLLLGSTACRVQAQGSLFSGLGYGVLESFSSSQAVGMGGTGIALRDSIALNAQNPAALATIQKARVSILGYASRQWMEDQQASDLTDWAQMEYFSLAFLVRRNVALGLAISPFSRVEFIYGWDSSAAGIPYHQTYKGIGGLTRIALQAAWAPTPRLQIGATGSVLWGEVEELRGSYFDASGYQDIEFLTSKQWLAFSGTLGIQAQPHPKWTLGAIFEPEVPIDLTRTFTYTGVDSEAVTEDQFSLAARYGFGASFQISPYWLLSGQALYTPWEQIDRLPDSPSDYQNSTEIAFGAQWKPGDWNSDRFLRRFEYRWGVRQEVGYVLSQGNPVNAAFMTLGLGYPLHEGRDRIDLGMEFGWRGNLSDNGGQEMILKFRLGLNLGETWFSRPKPPWEQD